MAFEDLESHEPVGAADTSHRHGWRGKPPQWFRVGCITLSSFVVGVLLVGLVLAVALWQCGYFGDPRFIADVEPNSTHRVYVNRCCGGSLPGSDPYQIFYGSDEPFSSIAQHYLVEMKKRGFTMWRSKYALQKNQIYYGFAKQGWGHCFSIEPYAKPPAHADWFGVPDGKLDRLSQYPYAYVATYLDVCDGSMGDQWADFHGNPVCLDTVDNCRPYQPGDLSPVS